MRRWNHITQDIIQLLCIFVWERCQEPGGVGWTIQNPAGSWGMELSDRVCSPDLCPHLLFVALSNLVPFLWWGRCTCRRILPVTRSSIKSLHCKSWYSGRWPSCVAPYGSFKFIFFSLWPSKTVSRINGILYSRISSKINTYFSGYPAQQRFIHPATWPTAINNSTVDQCSNDYNIRMRCDILLDKYRIWRNGAILEVISKTLASAAHTPGCDHEHWEVGLPF